MATYKGKVSLVNMSDITASAGVGISHSKILYIVSSTGDAPPDLKESSLTSISGDILAFADLGTSFHIQNGLLYAYQNDTKIQLATKAEVLTGIEGWSSTVPTVGAGQYLWTKTIYYYTNGDETVTYGIYRWGENGEPGEQGPPGASAASFRIDANQQEILKFVELDGAVTFSPEVLEFAIYKNSTSPDSELYYEQVRGLSKERFSLSVYNIKTNQYINIPSSFIEFNDILDVFTLNLTDLNQEVEAFQILVEEECVIKPTYNLQTEDGNFNLVEYLNVRYGIRKDMAALSVEAGKIVQSIQNSYLTFSSTGLTIQNGGFQILDEYGGSLLESTRGNLIVTGTINANDGYFAGELRSETGYFKGSITATEGLIGGFVISDNKLQSSKTYISKVDGNQEIFLPNIVLDGINGSVFARDIVIGVDASIEEYLRLGEAYIYNPSNNNNKFIQAGNIELSQTGLLNLGSIELYGGDEQNQAYIQSKNGKWSIREDGVAIFNDIYADNVHLQNTILETGTVQAIGSLMVFKDSWSVVEFFNDKIVLDVIANLEVGDWIYSGKNIYQIVSVTFDNGKTALNLNKTFNKEDGFTVTKFGQISTSDNPGFILSVLGEQDAIKDNRQFASGNSLTISDFLEENGTLIYKKRLVLGQLDGAIDKNIRGLGLYADNVFLNGSLTTKVDQDSYAGINTIGEATATVFNDNDRSRVIFWAGSTSSANEDIQNAPFQVTEKGSIYAGKGIFRDSIISDSIIQGADIYAARIHGGTTEQAGALTIYDTAMGIVFKEGYQSTEKEVFSIRADGLQQANSYFIEIKDDRVKFCGDKFIIDTKRNNKLEIGTSPIKGVDLTMIAISDGFVEEKSYQNVSIDKISWGFNRGFGREESLAISKEKSEIKSLTTWIENDVFFGTDNSYMQYKKTQEGYDLFINE